MSEALTALLRRVQRNLRDRGYRDEEAVRTGIVIPVLKELGWPPGSIHENYLVGQERPDIALILPRHRKPFALLELRRVGRVDDALKQLYEYCYWEDTEFGVTTDGERWMFHLPLKKGEVDRVDLTRDSVEHVQQCLARYLAFSRVRNGAALNAAKKDYEKKLREDEHVRENKAQFDALQKEMPKILNDIIIHNPHPDILKVFVRECRNRIAIPLHRDVVEEVLRSLEQPDWAWRATINEPEEMEPVHSGRYRAVVVGEWRGNFRNFAKAQVVFFNALERECGIAILRELAPLHIGTRRQLLAPTRDEISERNNKAWKESKPLECGWWLCTHTNTPGKDKMAEQAVEIARRLRPDLRVEWRPTNSELQPKNGDKTIKPPVNGRAKVRIVVGDTQGDYATGTDALIALLNAAWKIFGQGAFEALAQETRGTTRQLVARSQNEIGLPGSYARESARQLESGWWLCVNTSQVDKTRIANKLRDITSRTHPHVPVKWIDLK